MKHVYLAHDTLLDRDVAISVIKDSGLDANSLDRVRRETQAMGKLGDHPNIVTIYDIGDENDQLFIVSQYVEGGSVADLLMDAENHRLDVRRAMDITEDICRALEHAHAREIVHRDLKPANVWIGADGKAKLGDFGLAIPLDQTRITQEGLMLGTVAYMPPEQALGRQPEPRSDLYSLGVTLYEMVTGRLPFEGRDGVSIIAQHINTAPVPPAWHNPDIPAALETLILELLAKTPEERPPSATATLERLAAVSSAPPEAPSRPDAGGIDRLAWGRFVGREDILRRLKTAIDASLGGQATFLMVVGEAGIGKTRLVEEASVLARLRGIQVLTGSCHETEAGLPYLPFVEAIRQYVLARPAEALRKELGSGASDVAKLVSEIRQRVPDLPPSPQVEAEQERYRLFESVTSFLLNASSANTLLLVLEDLHWADRPSLLLLQHLARRIKGSRLVIIGTYRDTDLDRSHPLSETLVDLRRDRLYERIRLRGLSVGEIAELLETLFQHDVTERGQALARALHRESDGNPFFMEEIMRHLVETGTLYLRDGRWESDATSIREMGIPEGIREVVGWRLSRLSEQCNTVLSHAAILGREFDFTVLGRMVDLDEDGLLEAVEEASEHQLISEVKDRSAPTYSFMHALVRQSLHEETSIPRRQRLHLRAAKAIEGRYQGDLDRHLPALASHYRLAGSGGDVNKAVDYSIRAGEAMRGGFAYEEAIDHWVAASELMEEAKFAGEQRGRLLERLGSLMLWSGIRAQESMNYLEAALRAYEEIGRDDRAARVHSRLGQALTSQFEMINVPLALDHFRAAEPVLCQEEEGLPLGHLYLGMATASTFGLRIAEGLTASSRALEIAERLKDPAFEALARTTHGMHTQASGHLEEGIQLMETAWANADRGNHATSAFVAAWHRGATSTYLNDPQEAAGRFLRELEKPRLAPGMRNNLANYLADAHVKMGNLAEARRLLGEDRTTPASHGEGNLLFMEGEWEQAEKLLAGAREHHLKTGNRNDQWAVVVELARVRQALEDTAGAVELLEEATAVASDGGHVPYEFGSRAALGTLLADLGQPEKAREHLGRLAEILGGGEDWRGLVGEVSLCEAAIACAEKRVDAGGEHFGKAIEVFQRFALPWKEAEALRLWGRAFLAEGERSLGVEKLDAAIEIYQLHGAGAGWVERIESEKAGVST